MHVRRYRREHDAVLTTKRAGERANLPHHPEHEQFDGLMRTSIATGKQGAHVAGDAAGYAEQPGTPIEQVRDLDGQPGGNPTAWAGLISAYILSSAVVALGGVPYFWPTPQWLRHVLVLPLAVGRSASLDRIIRSTASQTPKTASDPCCRS